MPWVRERLVRLSSAYVRGYELRPEALEQQFEALTNFDPTTFDPTNPEAFADVELPDPGSLLDAMQTPAQKPVLEELQRFSAVLEGYADTVVDAVGEPLVPSLRQIEEALRRHRVDRGRAADFVDRMLGLELGREHYEQGHSFCLASSSAAARKRSTGCGSRRRWSRHPTSSPRPASGSRVSTCKSSPGSRHHASEASSATSTEG